MYSLLKILKRTLLHIILWLTFSCSFAQTEKANRQDSIFTNQPDSIQLDKVIIISPLHFKNNEERAAYLLLRKKTRNVWPYAVMASERLTVFRQRLDSLDTKAQKRQYTRIVQHYMENEFKDQLKKLTKSEGQILVKLIYRQTGETTFDIIRDVRTGWRAFRYNLTAHLFTISLKEEYDPYHVREDFIIEHILQWAFQHDQLKEQKPAIPIDQEELLEKWENTDLFNP